MFKMNAASFLASLLALASADAKTYRVRVRNLAYSQPMSPPLVVAHTRDIAIFQEGAVSSDELKLMAENGDNSALVDLITMDPSVYPYVCGYAVADGVLLPGETVRIEVDVDTDVCGDSALYSLVSMLVNTNDAFVGIDSDMIGTTKVFPPAFDAGTEENNELCSHIPGPACDADSGNLEDGPGEGFIHINRGVHGIGNLTASVYDWRNPVAEVFVTDV